MQELREQADRIQAERGCDGGCGPIDFILNTTPVPPSDARSPVPVEGRVLGADGAEVGGLILFLKDGMLESLEIYSHDKPLPLPREEQVTWLL